jgi:hypothetical protein
MLSWKYSLKSRKQGLNTPKIRALKLHFLTQNNMEIKSKLSQENDFETITMLAECLIYKLEKNKLLKKDRELLAEAVSIIYELNLNRF